MNGFSFGLATFVKTPGETPAKTRLGKSIGQGKAEEFYLLSLACIRENLQFIKNSRPSLKSYWSVVEHSEAAKEYWNDQPILHQVSGGLGDKLDDVDEFLCENHTVSVFMGADSPQIHQGALKEFFDRCDSLQQEYKNKPWCLMAPTFDGGFWLMAKNNRFSPTGWLSVNYSKDTTCEDIIKSLQAEGFQVEEFLPPQWDVDTIEDLLTIKSDLSNAQGEAQIALLNWMDQF